MLTTRQRVVKNSSQRATPTICWRGWRASGGEIVRNWNEIGQRRPRAVAIDRLDKLKGLDTDWQRGKWVVGCRAGDEDCQCQFLWLGPPRAINVVHCDGALRSVNYNVALPAFINFADRDDGNAFSPGDLN